MADHFAESTINKKYILLSQRQQGNSEHHVSLWGQREVSLTLMCKKSISEVLGFCFSWSQRFWQAIPCAR